MKNRVIIALFLFTALVCGLFAGDKAEFVNLGFSADGHYFFFGQYGYDLEEGQNYADLYMVDVRGNRFVPAGVFSGEYKGSLEPGQTPDGALFSLLESATVCRKKYGIDYMMKGRPLYIRISDSEESMDVLDFRDFETGSRYSMKLVQEAAADDEGEVSESSFHIDMSYIGSGGVEVPFVIGHPDFKRAGIASYRIERVLTDPSGSSVIIIIAKIDNDLNVRYMVETVRIR